MNGSNTWPREFDKLMHCKTCLILSMRHLGDAVITSEFINALNRYNPDIDIDVLGRPEMETVTASFCNFRKYISINLPIFGHHKKGIKELTSAFHQLLQVRRHRYSCCINLVGDIRENLIGKLVGAEDNIAPIWDNASLFRKHIRNTGAHWLLDYGVRIPSELSNMYDSLEFFSIQLGVQQLERIKDSMPAKSTNPVPVIAIHPGASQPSKRWLPEKWRAVIRRLHADGKKIILLGSPSERSGLFDAFNDEIKNFSLDVVTESLPIVLDSLSKSDILVGMDSFSVHAAHALGIPVIVLHGPFDPAVMTPPGGIPLSSGNMCKVFPCYNKPSCRGTEYEYICIRGIEVNAVVNAIETQLLTACICNDE